MQGEPLVAVAPPPPPRVEVSDGEVLEEPRMLPLHTVVLQRSIEHTLQCGKNNDFIYNAIYIRMYTE